jgi:GNAT superfamily N-acetyltransferase
VGSPVGSAAAADLRFSVDSSVDLAADGGATFRVAAGGEEVARLTVRARELTYGRTSTIRYAEITELFVRDDYRRRGLASRLLDAALGWAAAAGFERIAVEATARAGAPGPAFYAAVGFTPRSVIYDVVVPGG